MRLKKILLLACLSLTATSLYMYAPKAVAACDPLPGDKGLNSNTVTVEKAGEYTLWLRMLASSPDRDSVFVQIDDQCTVVANDNKQQEDFLWTNLHNEGSTSKPMRFTLTAGAHTIKVAGREAGAGLDKILLTDAACVPREYGDNCMEEAVTPAETTEPTEEASKASQPSTTKLHWWIVIGSGLAFAGAAGLLIWKYLGFIKKIALQVEFAVEHGLTRDTKLRTKILHFVRHELVIVSICGAVLVIALLVGIVAAASSGRSILEAEAGSLYGGAKIAEHMGASDKKYVVFEVNPAGTTVPQEALKKTGGSTGSSSNGGGTGGSSGGGQSSGGSGDGGGSTTPPGECPAYPAFPDDSCTGWQHTGVTLRTCEEGDGDEGDGHLELSNVTYDGCDFADGAVIHGANVTIKRSRVQGVVSAHWSTDYDFRNLTLIDVEIIAATPEQIAAKNVVNNGGGSALNGANVSCLRCRIHYVPTGISLGNGSSIRDSYISDVTWGPGAHQAAIGAGGNSGHNSTLVHNRLDCSRWNVNAPGFEQGCSSALSLYDEPTLNNVLVQNNLFDTAGGFCTYGGGPQGTNIRYINNLFGKKYSSSCGIYGPVSAFYSGNAGNAWTGNAWLDGSGAISP